MPTYSVAGAGSKGYFSDKDMAPEHVEKEAWTAVRDVRMNNGSVGSVGAVQVSGFGANNDEGADRDITEVEWVNTATGLKYILYGSQISQAIGSTTTRIAGASASPPTFEYHFDASFPNDYVDSYPYAQPWVVAKLGGLPMATRGQTVDNTGTDFISPQVILDLTISPLEADPFPGFEVAGDWYGVIPKVVASYKNFAIMANILDGSDPNDPYYPTMVWWSHPAELGAFPTSDDWDYTDPTNLAGRHMLPTDAGQILAIEPLKDDLIIYTSAGMHRMTYIGGQFVFKFSSITTTSGIIGFKGVAEVDGRHVIVTQDDVVLHDGQNGKSIAEGRVREEMFSNQGSNARSSTYVTNVTKHSEVWITFGSDEYYGGTSTTKDPVQFPGRAFIWNYKEDTWTVINYNRDLQSEVGDVSGDICGSDIWIDGKAEAALTCIKELPVMGYDAQDTSNTYDASVETYDSVGTSYNTVVDVKYDWSLFGAMAHRSDEGLWFADAEDMSLNQSGATHPILQYPYMQVERESINLSDDETSNIITWVYPKVKAENNALYGYTSYSPIYVTLGSQTSSSSPVTWEDPILYWVGSSGLEIPRRMRAKLRGVRHAIRFETCGGGKMVVNGYDIVWEASGDR